MAARNEVNTGKRGRPRKEDVEAMNQNPYTEAELYELWRFYRGQQNEIEMLEGFSCLDRNAAIDLSQSFWKRWTHENAQNAP